MAIVEMGEIELVSPSVAVSTLRGFIRRFIQSDDVTLSEEAVGLIFPGDDLAEALNSVKSLGDKRLADGYKEINGSATMNESNEGQNRQVCVKRKKVGKGQNHLEIWHYFLHVKLKKRHWEEK